MEYYFAPLEGITYYNFRAVHHSIFPGIDQYYTPFIVATYTHKMKSREKRDVLPENNIGVPVVPQILTGDAEEFLFCAKYLADFGYREVNLNAGCPVGTVTAKGKGSGLLRDPDRLDRLLYGIFEGLERNPILPSGGSEVFVGHKAGNGEAVKGTQTFSSGEHLRPLRISVKTRLGWEDPREFEKILQIYFKYPISALIIHARTRAEMYSGEPELETFAAAYDAVTGSGKAGSDREREDGEAGKAGPGSEQRKMRLCYNGNIRTPEDAAQIEARFPKLDAVMIGRGLLEHPALVTEILAMEKERHGNPICSSDKGSASFDGAAWKREEEIRERAKIREFHDELYKRYADQFRDERILVDHMKELWGYLGSSFPDSAKAMKAIRKARKCADYEAAVRMMWV